MASRLEMSVGSGDVTLQAAEPPCSVNDDLIKLNGTDFSKWRTDL